MLILINIRVPSKEAFLKSFIFLSSCAYICCCFWTGWHVFNGGNSTIPTHCVTEYHCGTKYPVWMKGTLPSVGVTASRQGCIAMSSGTSGSCCELTIDIKVKNCGHFYVYHLKPTHFCPMAYCAGMYTYDSIFKKLKLKMWEILVFNVMLWYFFKKKIKISFIVSYQDVYLCLCRRNLHMQCRRFWRTV